MANNEWLVGATPNEAVTWYDVINADGKFVAVGYGDDNDKRAIYSLDGKNWLPCSFILARHVVWNSVAFGLNKFVAVGSGTAHIYHFMYSSNGIDGWTATTGGIATADWQGVAFGLNKFVAVGIPGSGGLDNQRACYSTDGINWTLATTPNALSTTYWYNVAFGNDIFIAVGRATDRTKQAMRSVNGIDWEILTTPNVNCNFYKIAYGNGVWVAVGNSWTDETIQIMYSTDNGETWHITNSGVPTAMTTWYSSAFGNGIFVVGSIYTSGAELLLYSYNGIDWYSFTTPDADIDYRCIAFGNNTWVALGDNPVDRTKSAIYMTIDDVSITSTIKNLPLPTVGLFTVGKSFDISQYELGRYLTDYPFEIIFNYRDGGFKKRIYVGADNCAIKKVKFSINEKGCANARVEFAYLDWTIDKYDTVDIYYKGRKIYHGLVNDKPDIDGGEISIVPQRVRLEHFIFNRVKYKENVSALTLLETTVKTKQEYHRVSYNPYFIDDTFKENDGDLVLPEFQDSEIKNMIEDVIKTIDSDAQWGVNENNIFFVRYPESTVSKRLFLCDKPYYKSIKVRTQYENIKSTRAIVYRKGDTEKTPVPETEDVKSGTVCYPDSDPLYPTQTNLENEVGVIEEIISISSIVEDGTALAYAFNKIKSQQIEKTIEITGVDIDRYFPEVGKRIQVEKIYDKKVLWTLSDCETLDGWEGSCAVSPVRAIEGNNSMMSGASWFRLDNIYHFDGIEKIEFFVYCEEGDFELQVDILQNDDVIKSSTVRFQNKLWQRVEIAIDTGFSGIYFNPNYVCWIDRIKVYSYKKEIYEANVKEVEFNIDAKGYECNLTLGNFDIFVNDTLQWLEWKVGVIDGIKKIPSN